MLGNLKALIIVLCLAVPIFILARTACLHFMSDADFRLRRLIWLVSTLAVFLSPTAWVFFLVIVPVTIWAVKKDTNPLAMLTLIGATSPAFSVMVPHVLPLSLSRMFALFVMLPLLLRRESEAPNHSTTLRRQGTWAASLLAFAFFSLQVTPYLKIYSSTEVLRMELLVLLDCMVPFWFAIKILKSYRSINEVIAVFVLTCAVMAPIAAFESIEGWLLYAGVAQKWAATMNPFAYVGRGDRLRALVVTDHSLSLGFMMALAFGFWLHLQRSLESRTTAWAGGLLMWVGMWAAYSRGPWIAAVLLMFAYFWLMPKGTSRALKGLLGAGLLMSLLAITPYGAGIIDSLPFVGTLDSENVDYRSRLFSLSMELIPSHLWFGDIFVETHMESLRQGQGIIDLVNGFLLIALYYGLVPLIIFVLFLLLVLWRLQLASLRSRRFDLNISSLGSNLVACILAALFFMWVARYASELLSMSAMALAYAKLVDVEHRNGARL